MNKQIKKSFSQQGVHGHGANVKKRPCLKCDKMFFTTPETRICGRCKQDHDRHSSSFATLVPCKVWL